MLKMNPNYNRVIPRDFFNESKLLKCMGQLSLKIHDGQLSGGIKIHINKYPQFEDVESFNVALADDGFLTILNYEIQINDSVVIMKSLYNSKDNFPLFCEWNNCDYRVFTEDGDFDQEFIETFKDKL